ncbi:MAG: VaFE repeat-containing surface-anchored protein [Oscillospiraceae bacterium]|nr:VaFE repeat-containing surface-anchored protein [Oscillospiraceae bacterium]
MKHTDTGLTKIETPEEGATFEVYLTSAGSYAKADDAIRDRLIIDKDGFAKSKDLPYGTYTVHQAEGWDGSAFIQDFQVKIDTDGKTYSYIINNERFYAFLKVVKLDSVTGEPIPVEGIGFQIFTPAGELVSFWDVDTWYSNAEGVVKVPTDLEYGKGYTAVEQNAPEGYILATEPFTFDITPENAATEDDLLVVTLEAKNTPTQVQVLKVDPYGKPVSGAKLQVVDANGKVVDEWISDDAPHTIYKLPVGATFTLREIEAPDGYLLAESVTFTVQETAEVQTVTMENEKIPTIGTTATVNDLHVAQPKGEIDLIDTVHYSDVVPGRTYTVAGVIMDKATGEPITDADGKQLTASRTFTPEASESDVEVIFHVDAALLEGKTTVCCEHLFKNGKQIAVHADLSDEGQTVYWPDIHTTATVNGEHEAYMGGTVTLVDVVEYKGVQPGKEYTVKGVLMDLSTGEPFHDISVETLVTPTEANGAVEVTFQFDTSMLTEDLVLVAFETLYYNGRELAVHADLEDEGQTVTIYGPTLHTTATVNGEKDAVAEKMVKITDVVTYTNLTVGKEYTLKGTLMNKAPREPFEVNGEAVTAEVTFTPEKPSGEVTVTFVFDGSAIKTDTTLVVFETLYLDELELIVHADIDDADQTITIRNPDTPQTGDSSKIGIWLGLAGTLLGCGIACVIVYHRIRREDAGE